MKMIPDIFILFWLLVLKHDAGSGLINYAMTMKVSSI